MKRELEHYLRLRYPMEIVEAEEGGFFARLPDLPGCMAQGETIEEAVRNLNEAKQGWIEARLEDHQDVPLPHEIVEEYSGKFVLRVPKSLHRELATRARREGTSLNQYLVHLLSLALGQEQRAEQEVQWHEERMKLLGLASWSSVFRAVPLGNVLPVGVEPARVSVRNISAWSALLQWHEEGSQKPQTDRELADRPLNDLAEV